MPNAGYLLIRDFKGTSLIKGRENQIPILAVSHELDDGKHKPIVLTKPLDLTSPLFHEAQSKCTVLPSAYIDLYHMPASGDEKKYFTITLTDVQVVCMKTIMPSVLEPANANVHEYEEVTLIYKSIDWKHHGPLGGLDTGYSHSSTSQAPAPLAEDWLDDKAKAGAFALVQKGFEEAKIRAKTEYEKIKAKITEKP